MQLLGAALAAGMADSQQKNLLIFVVFNFLCQCLYFAAFGCCPGCGHGRLTAKPPFNYLYFLNFLCQCLYFAAFGCCLGCGHGRLTAKPPFNFCGFQFLCQCLYFAAFGCCLGCGHGRLTAKNLLIFVVFNFFVNACTLQLLGAALAAGMADSQQDVHDRALFYYRQVCMRSSGFLCRTYTTGPCFTTGKFA